MDCNNNNIEAMEVSDPAVVDMKKSERKTPFDPNAPFACHICEKNMNSESQVEVHVLGKKHKDMVQAKESGKMGEEEKCKQTEVIDPLQRTIAKDAGIDISQYQNDKSKLTDKKFEKFGFHCSVCNCYMTGQIQLFMHVKGSKHREKVEGNSAKKCKSNYNNKAATYNQAPVQTYHPMSPMTCHSTPQANMYSMTPLAQQPPQEPPQYVYAQQQVPQHAYTQQVPQHHTYTQPVPQQAYNQQGYVSVIYSPQVRTSGMYSADRSAAYSQYYPTMGPKNYEQQPPNSR